MKAIRVRFSKRGKIRFTSHRDVARLWERALRKVDLPVAYTEGFSPRPRLAFGLALSTGYESLGEYIDISLDPAGILPCRLEALPEVLSPALPEGLEVTGVAALAPNQTSLQQAVSSCSWEIELMNMTTSEAEAWVQRALAAPTLPVTRERKGRAVTDDVRPGICSLEVRAAADRAGPHLIAELATQPRALRPSELLDAVEPRPTARLVRRLHQWIEWEGARHEPLEVGTTAVVLAGGDAAPVPLTQGWVR